jgi:hypothetical protein
MYKNILDIHIDSKIIEEIEQVTVTFFWNENPTDKKFFVVFTHQDNCWKGMLEIFYMDNFYISIIIGILLFLIFDKTSQYSEIKISLATKLMYKIINNL